ATDVGNVHEWLAGEHTRMGAVQIGLVGSSAHGFCQLARHAPTAGRTKLPPIKCPEHGETGLAQSQCALEDNLEYRRKISGGAVYDLQDFGSRGLPIERLAQFTEEPLVVDAGEGLRGRGRDRIDLHG